MYHLPQLGDLKSGHETKKEQGDEIQGFVTIGLQYMILAYTSMVPFNFPVGKI